MVVFFRSKSAGTKPKLLQRDLFGANLVGLHAFADLILQELIHLVPRDHLKRKLFVDLEACDAGEFLHHHVDLRRGRQIGDLGACRRSAECAAQQRARQRQPPYSHAETQPQNASRMVSSSHTTQVRAVRYNERFLESNGEMD